MENSIKGSCSCGSGSCEPEQKEKQAVIDFLYLDLSVCGRCKGAENNLDEAVDEVKVVLKSEGYHVIVNKVNITSKELAEEYKFLSSPTIRVNENDIEMKLKESSCTECGDLSGKEVDCRVWIYDGEEYADPPKAMIVNGILKGIYGGEKTKDVKAEEYKLPENLKIFFEGSGIKKYDSLTY